MRCFIFVLTFLFLSSALSSPHTFKEPTIQDRNECKVQAQVSAKALQNARLEITLEEQLALWDTFVSSDISKKFSADQIADRRQLIIMAWNIFEKYPTLTPNTYGDYVYSTCIDTAIHNDRIKF